MGKRAGKFIRSLLLCVAASFSLASLARGAEETAIDRDTVLKWVEQYRDTKPDFKPGDILTRADLEKLRPFILPGHFAEFHFPEVRFTIIAPRDNSPHPAYREATEKFAGQVRLAEDGALIDYVAGQPFPNERLDPQDPFSGLKAAWNFNFRWQNYGQKVVFTNILVRGGGTHEDPKGLEGHLKGGGTIERVVKNVFQRVYFTHLAWLPEHDYTLPLPQARQFEYKDYIEFSDPYDMRGARLLVHRYADPHRADDSWEYVPNLRKVRRISAEVKEDPFVGGETTLEDFYGFSGRLPEHTWTFHGWKEVLGVMNSGHKVAHFYGPNGWLPEDQWEVRRCAVVEQIPKNPRHPYSSKLLFWDAQTYQTVMAVAFDREGRLWKVLQPVLAWSEGVNDMPEVNRGKFLSLYHAVVTIDFQNHRATVAITRQDSYPDVEPEYVQELYDVSKLAEGRR